LCECYRIGTLARLGRWDDAIAALSAARATNVAATDVTAGWRADNALYLDYEELKLALRKRDAKVATVAHARCEAAIATRSMGPWPATGIVVRGIEAALLARAPDIAASRFDRLARIGRDHPSAASEVGRGAAHLLADAASRGEALEASLRAHLDRYLASIPATESSALHDAARAAESPSAESLAALVAADIR
jgi:hypothetical protein